MRRRGLLLALLLVALPAWAGDMQVLRRRPSTVSAQVYLFRETFDGGSTLCVTSGPSTCDNTWTNPGGGTLTFNYATAPAPLEGTLSLRFSGASGQEARSPSYTGSASKTYWTAIFRGVTGGTNIFVPILYTTGAGAQLGGIQLVWTTDHWNPKLWSSGLSSGSTPGAATISTAQTWYLKLEYTPGSGANAVWTMYAVQDSGGFPGWGTAQTTVTNASDTATAALIDIQNNNTSGEWIVDDIRVSVSDITYP